VTSATREEASASRTWGKTDSRECGAGRAVRNYVFVAPPPMWKPQGAPNAAPGSELLDFEPFGKASSGAGFGAGF